MTDFANAVTELIVSASCPLPSPEDVQDAANHLHQRISETPSAELDEGLPRLADCIENCSPLFAGALALCCGAMVENGGDPLLALKAILDRLPEVLLGTEQFVLACRAAGEAQRKSEEEEPDPIERFGREVSQSQREAAYAYCAFEPLSLGAIAMLSRSKEARRFARARSELLPLCHAVDKAHAGAAGFLTRMLQVLDDESVLVIHPAEGKGYRLCLSGIGTNFELFVLLADALIGSPAQGWLSGEKPDPALAAACRDQPAELAEGKLAVGAFNFCNWQALGKDRTLPDQQGSSDLWIWGEGVPADIRLFEGQRVILLGPPLHRRIFKGARCFGGMEAELRVEAKLSAAEVNVWLSRFSAAAK